MYAVRVISEKVPVENERLPENEFDKIEKVDVKIDVSDLLDEMKDVLTRMDGVQKSEGSDTRVSSGV